MPTVACIGGSMAYRLMAEGALDGEDLGPRETPFGPSAPVHRISDDGDGFFFLSRHGERGYHIAPSFVNNRANLWALKDLGTQQVIAWSAAGAVNRKMRPGSLVVVDDLIDWTFRRAPTFYEHGGLGVLRQQPAFSEVCRAALLEACNAAGLMVHKAGTYVCTEGPRLETPAEVRMFAAFGADLVGMSLAPEVFLARELEMSYAALCYVANFAEGVVPRPFKPGLHYDGMTEPGEDAAVEATVKQLPEVIRRAVTTLAATPGDQCPFRQAMARYRRRGDIGDDWRKWAEPGAGAD